MANPFENQNSELRRRNVYEGQEVQAEIKEKKTEEQEKKAAAMERAEKVGKEVQNTQKQMQNIMANMQQVIKAVQAIRAQLQLDEKNSIPSLERDEKDMEVLKKKLVGLRGELKDLRLALIIELKKDLHSSEVGLDDENLQKEAERQADLILKKFDTLE